MSDPVIDLLVDHGYKYNSEAGSWSKEGKQPTFATKPWVGLTDEDKREIIQATERDDRGYVMALVEAKLKGKNHDQ